MFILRCPVFYQLDRSIHSLTKKKKLSGFIWLDSVLDRALYSHKNFSYRHNKLMISWMYIKLVKLGRILMKTTKSRKKAQVSHDYRVSNLWWTRCWVGSLLILQNFLQIIFDSLMKLWIRKSLCSYIKGNIVTCFDPKSYILTPNKLRMFLKATSYSHLIQPYRRRTNSKQAWKPTVPSIRKTP